MNALVAILIALYLTGCATPTVSDVARFTDDVKAACRVAVAVAPNPYVLAGCLTADGLAYLASDPSSVAWLNGMIAKAQADVKRLRA